MHTVRQRFQTIPYMVLPIALLASCAVEERPDADLESSNDAFDQGGDAGEYREEVSWTPPSVYTDTPYVQEHADFPQGLPSPDVLALHVTESGLVLAGTAKGAAVLQADSFERFGPVNLGGPVSAISSCAGKVLLAGSDSAFLGGEDSWKEIQVKGIRSAVCYNGSVFLAATESGLIELDSDGTMSRFPGWPGGPCLDVAVTGEESPAVVVATKDEVYFWNEVPGWKRYRQEDGIPSGQVRAVAAGPEIWVGTSNGLAKYEPDQDKWSKVTWVPYRPVVDLFMDGQGLVVSSEIGAYAKWPERWRYYHSLTWLPSDTVRAAARSGDGTLYFATENGVARIAKAEYTLADKAALFDELTQERHVRLGFTSTENHLSVPGDTSTSFNTDDDNDGQWTEMYLASQCFRYSVTGDEKARDNARKAARAMLWLEEVTGVPGFFARSIVPGEECPAKQKAGGGEWHLSGDGKWCWKGDTSADEWVGHFFGLPLYYDLVADQEEKEKIAGMLSRIVDRAIEYGYKLVDIDGEVTTWGRFDPDFMKLEGQFGDAGLNSAKFLGALAVAYYMTGDPKYMDHFEKLAYDYGYLEYVRQIEQINTRVQINHDSEEMSFLAMFTLIRYDRDETRHKVWLEGLEYLWEVQRPERDPEFNMLYAAMAEPDDYDLDESIRTLKEIPLNLVKWANRNSHRNDYTPNGRDRHKVPQSKEVYPYDERQPMRWAENPYALDQPGDGRSECSGTFWLLPYWLGRHLGVITGPER